MSVWSVERRNVALYSNAAKRMAPVGGTSYLLGLGGPVRSQVRPGS